MNAGDIRRSSIPPRNSSTFPDLSDNALNDYAVIDDHFSPASDGSPRNRLWSGTTRWQGKFSVLNSGPLQYEIDPRRHDRQKSLSQALQTVRARHGSVSQGAQEIAQALKAPVSYKLVFLCGCWYATSILTNTSSKAILTAFPKPLTLTVIQFLSVCSWCLISAWLGKNYRPVREAVPILRNGILSPAKAIFVHTLPLTAFQIGGHILNSDAMARIPVSLVHTIKGLSPLLTVLAYRIFFRVSYSTPTYLSLIPLTLGVIMACSASFRAEFLGILYAFGSALAFVTQNIVSKKLFNEAARAEADHTPYKHQKPDKLNLLCYSSGLALAFTLPLWLWYEGLPIFGDFMARATVQLSERPGSLDHGRLALEYIFNGVFHFLQSLVAFALLGMVSPVTYSVASLIKRVFVIVFAIIWFGNRMTRTQGFGIALTIFGLYLYDRTSDAAKADKTLAARQGVLAQPLLPLNTRFPTTMDSRPKTSHDPQVYSAVTASAEAVHFSPARFRSHSDVDKKRNDDHARSPAAALGATNDRPWLPPGTKQEETWKPEDSSQAQKINA